MTLPVVRDLVQVRGRDGPVPALRRSSRLPVRGDAQETMA